MTTTPPPKKKEGNIVKYTTFCGGINGMVRASLKTNYLRLGTMHPLYRKGVQLLSRERFLYI